MLGAGNVNSRSLISLKSEILKPSAKQQTVKYWQMIAQVLQRVYVEEIYYD